MKPSNETLEVIENFDPKSGGFLERFIFNNRVLVLIFCLVVSVVLGYSAYTRMEVNASFERMIPHNHPFIKNYLANKEDLRGLGNVLRVVVENTEGDIYDRNYIEKLRKVADALWLTNGVDRSGLKSLWAPSVRWIEVTEEGFSGDAVMSDSYDGSAQSLLQLRQNVARSKSAQELVSMDGRSSMIFVPLLDKDPETGTPLDYRQLSHSIEHDIRQHFESDTDGPKIQVYVIGFAKLMGDLLDGLMKILAFFVIAVAIAISILYFYTRCVRSTLIVISCSLVGVLWQLGFVSALGYQIDPFSALVPFVIFAIGVSHGAQKMNGVIQDVGRGLSPWEAARMTFRRLFVAGWTALLLDAVGFGVLLAIDFPIIKDLAITASIGVAMLVVTNLIMLPVALSYVGVNKAAAKRNLPEEKGRGGFANVWTFLALLTGRRWAIRAISVALGITMVGAFIALDLKIGDLDAGAPELRPGSRYNQDNAYITSHYAMSSDQFAVIVKVPKDQCLSYQALIEADRLAWTLGQVPGVQGTVSIANSVRLAVSGSYEGSQKWATITRNQASLSFAGEQVLINSPDLTNKECSTFPVVAYLTDHKADTLERVTAAASSFADAHSNADIQFLLAAGSSGIEAATNMTVRASHFTMTLYVYMAVLLLSFIAFRSWRASLVAVIPLMMTTVLCEAIMVVLGIGVKVATLPVIALGVGIGIDYALYLITCQLAYQRSGLSLRDSYFKALQFTGRVVALVGAMLAAAVVTWVWSPIKFQADMGVLLTFMFLANMVGALVLVPALSHFLLSDKYMDKIRGSALPHQPADATVTAEKSHAPIAELQS
jgi:predicted RND superfamily exporter protein